MNEEIVKPFLSRTIRICDRCNKMDIRTYARYKKYGDNYILDGAYSRCQNCEKVKKFTREELDYELKENNYEIK